MAKKIFFLNKHCFLWWQIDACVSFTKNGQINIAIQLFGDEVVVVIWMTNFLILIFINSWWSREVSREYVWIQNTCVNFSLFNVQSKNAAQLDVMLALIAISPARNCDLDVLYSLFGIWCQMTPVEFWVQKWKLFPGVCWGKSLGGDSRGMLRELNKRWEQGKCWKSQ